jgi:hypothetical protein
VPGDDPGKQSSSDSTSHTRSKEDENALLAWAASVSSADVSGGELSVKVFTEAGAVKIER